jgi:hypothetical protein
MIQFIDPDFKFQRQGRTKSWSESSYSVSAVGFAGLYELLNEVGPGSERLHLNEPIPVGGRLFLLTGLDGNYFLNHLSYSYEDELPKMTILYFIPKWNYQKHPDNSSWVANQNLMATLLVKDMMEDLLDIQFQPRVVRSPWPKEDDIIASFSAPTPTGPADSKTFQLLQDEELTEVVSAPGGLLVSRLQVDELTLYLVSDPDVANNMGLGLGQNSDFILKLIQHIMRQEELEGPITFCEKIQPDLNLTLARDSFLGPLATFPMIIIDILALLAGLIFFAALSRRFGGLGSNLPHDEHFGKSKLIENSAMLMARVSLLPSTLQAYQKMTIQRAGKALHAPRLANNQELVFFLDQVGCAKGIRPSLGSIMARCQKGCQEQSEEEMLGSAQDLYRFRKELESGSSHPGHSGQ